VYLLKETVIVLKILLLEMLEWSDPLKEFTLRQIQETKEPDLYKTFTMVILRWIVRFGGQFILVLNK
jgi:hypothetical protein